MHAQSRSSDIGSTGLTGLALRVSLVIAIAAGIILPLI
jgi:hypothetical protein